MRLPFAALSFLILLASGRPCLGADDDFRRAINLEWEAVPDAIRYEVEISRIDEKGQARKAFTTRVETPQWSGRIRAGRYRMRLRSFDDRNVPGDWSEPSEFWVKLPPPEALAPAPNAVIKTDSNDNFPVDLKWRPAAGTNDYLVAINGQELKVRGTETRLQLPVARVYTWTVTALMGAAERGETGVDPNSFTLVGKTLAAPRLQRPDTQIVQTLEWIPPPLAEKYTVTIERQDENKKWVSVQKIEDHREPRLNFDLSRPSGLYRLSVRAEANLRQPSSTESLEFQVQGDLKTPAEIANAKERELRAKRKYKYYFLANYFLSDLLYSGFNEEFSIGRAKFNALGGTGGLGVGYQTRSRWGVFGYVDMSGFLLNGEAYTFSAAELQATYTLALWSQNQFRILLGPYRKEIPEVRGDKTAASQGVYRLSDVETLSGIGLSTGFSLDQKLTDRLGLEVSSRLYLPMSGDNPAGEVKTTPSYQLGLMGSYRLWADLTGYAGYTYRVDEYRYPVRFFQPQGSTNSENSISLTGHYLSLRLFYGF